jgi:biotin/methionine sulfoxide reductase
MRSSGSTFTLAHWGLLEATPTDMGASRLTSWRQDANPSGIGLDQLGPEVAAMRVRRPSIRESWLELGPGGRPERRGLDRFVEVSWDVAIECLAGELRRVIERFGNAAIFGGSYGWASAGRFHHAQSQLHRFLNCVGGYVRSRDSYSYGAANVVMPHVVGPMDALLDTHTDWSILEEHTDLFISFGGLPLKNAQMTAGGVGQHVLQQSIAAMAMRGAHFVNISPRRADLDAIPNAEWIPIRPNTDTALMLALAHTLVEEGRHDAQFLDTHCVGFDKVADYLLGRSDHTPKDANWAETITEVPASRIRALAREMAERRTMLNSSWSLQRASHGEQPYWAIVTLAAILGQIGLPGGGFGVGYGAMNSVGSAKMRMTGPRLAQGRNPVEAFIPVARLSDMLLNPGGSFRYDGVDYSYPDIKLVYWSGGNPFHHHQDLNRLIRAWRNPQTIVIQDQFWTASAKAADIVLPVTTTLERDDIGYAPREGQLVAMKRLGDPSVDARSDFDIFAALADAMGVGDVFTEGLDASGWIRRIYEECRVEARERAIVLPPFEEFWERGRIELGSTSRPTILLENFRRDPASAPLSTPSGRIELYSERVARFADPECPGHACWIEPSEWLGSAQAAHFPIQLLSNQPQRRLHSQLDHGSYSQAAKIADREPIELNARDARTRGIRTGDVIRIFNERGSFLAGADVAPDLKAGVAVIATGAWFDPVAWDGASMEKHGNPNVVTADLGASPLSQGCAAQSCLVQIERFEGDPPVVTAFAPPQLVPLSGQKAKLKSV